MNINNSDVQTVIDQMKDRYDYVVVGANFKCTDNSCGINVILHDDLYAYREKSDIVFIESSIDKELRYYLKEIIGDSFLRINFYRDSSSLLKVSSYIEENVNRIKSLMLG